ncbi:transposase [Rhizobium tubonense]|uniref:transposase n=1 Tax=Rhizobium tubonense TaxID=484088 RepID=UPI001FCF1F3D|nr:transposase [Rhizobium tubonense]
MTVDKKNCVGPGDPVPHILGNWLSPFRPWFSAPSWDHLLVLVMGAVLCPGKRRVTACLRITGRAEAANFSLYHQFLNRARWDPRTLAARLLSIVVASLLPDGPIVIGMDDTIERRWGLTGC